MRIKSYMDWAFFLTGLFTVVIIPLIKNSSPEKRARREKETREAGGWYYKVKNNPFLFIINAAVFIYSFLFLNFRFLWLLLLIFAPIGLLISKRNPVKVPTEIKADEEKKSKKKAIQNHRVGAYLRIIWLIAWIDFSPYFKNIDFSLPLFAAILILLYFDAFGKTKLDNQPLVNFTSFLKKMEEYRQKGRYFILQIPNASIFLKPINDDRFVQIIINSSQGTISFTMFIARNMLNEAEFERLHGILINKDLKYEVKDIRPKLNQPKRWEMIIVDLPDDTNIISQISASIMLDVFSQPEKANYKFVFNRSGIIKFFGKI